MCVAFDPHNLVRNRGENASEKVMSCIRLGVQAQRHSTSMHAKSVHYSHVIEFISPTLVFESKYIEIKMTFYRYVSLVT